jgi:MoaA/NifB/PqqE/SkfB family radical SAM enzyme
MSKFFHVIRKSFKTASRAVLCKPMIFIPDLLITYHCTQKCLQCSIPSMAGNNHAFMTFEDYRQIIDKLDDHGTQIIVISGGEPMLHPDLPEFIRYAAKKRFARIHLLSNLYGSDRLVQQTVEAVLDTGISLSISFDGLGEVADDIRGAKNVSERVKKSIQYVKNEMKRRNKKIHCGVSVVLSQLNIHQAKEIIEYLEEVSWITDIDVYRWQSQSQMENDRLKFTNIDDLRAALDIAKRSPVIFTPSWLLDRLPEYLEGRFEKYCPYLSLPTFGTKILIQPDGSVKTCRGDAFGNILQQSIDDLFASKEWADQLEEKKTCPGCVNTLYTRSKYFFPTSIKELRSAWEQVWNL